MSNIQGGLEAYTSLNFIHNFFLENIERNNSLKTQYDDYIAFHDDILGPLGENYFDNE